MISCSARRIILMMPQMTVRQLKHQKEEETIANFTAMITGVQGLLCLSPSFSRSIILCLHAMVGACIAAKVPKNIFNEQLLESFFDIMYPGMIDKVYARRVPLPHDNRQCFSILRTGDCNCGPVASRQVAQTPRPSGRATTGVCIDVCVRRSCMFKGIMQHYERLCAGSGRNDWRPSIAPPSSSW